TSESASVAQCDSVQLFLFPCGESCMPCMLTHQVTTTTAGSGLKAPPGFCVGAMAGATMEGNVRFTCIENGDISECALKYLVPYEHNVSTGSGYKIYIGVGEVQGKGHIVGEVYQAPGDAAFRCWMTFGKVVY